ncbi:MAG: efflux RND transporter periplasmic adaptor subunit [Anaerohalosphaera sp.]|nr:efflux RND transporter periplasmic adaptor subunit [Anaerohalosphaera sp.]
MKLLMKLFRLFLILVIVAGIVFLGISLIKHKKQALKQAPKYGIRPIGVHAVTVKKGDLAQTIDYLAVVDSFQIANVSARLTSNVDKLLCDEGDLVKAGDVLIQLDSRELKQSIEAIEATIAKTQAEIAANQSAIQSLINTVSYWQREAQRDKTLADKGNIPASQAEATADKANQLKGNLETTKHQQEALKHQIQSLQSQKSQLETRLSYCTITSPYDGVVRQRLVDPGDLAAPGKILMVIEDRSQFKLTFNVPQTDLQEVQEGLPVRFNADGKKFSAELTHLYPSLNTARMLQAEVLLSGLATNNLDCGQYLRVLVLVDEIKDKVLVPASCLVECPEHFQHVFVVKDGSLTHHRVEILGSSGDIVAVEGIEPNQQVVTNSFLGWTTLSSGKKVEVLQ